MASRYEFMKFIGLVSDTILRSLKQTVHDRSITAVSTLRR